MNLADGIILLIVAISASIGLWRGFVREAFSLATWVAAFIVASLFHPGMQSLLESAISTPSVRMASAFAILFVATLIIGSLLSRLFTALVQVTGLTGTDRALGVVFGLLRGLVLVVVLVAVLQASFAQDAWWSGSLLVPWFLGVQQTLWLFFGQLMGWIMSVAGH